MITNKEKELHKLKEELRTS